MRVWFWKNSSLQKYEVIYIILHKMGKKLKSYSFNIQQMWIIKFLFSNFQSAFFVIQQKYYENN